MFVVNLSLVSLLVITVSGAPFCSTLHVLETCVTLSVASLTSVNDCYSDFGSQCVGSLSYTMWSQCCPQICDLHQSVSSSTSLPWISFGRTYCQPSRGQLLFHLVTRSVVLRSIAIVFDPAISAMTAFRSTDVIICLFFWFFFSRFPLSSLTC